MKYCMYCGTELPDDAGFCIRCGSSTRPVGPAAPRGSGVSDVLITVVKVFLILGCVQQSFLLLPLAWCLPITLSVMNCFRDRRPVGMGLKICSLLFVNFIAGICLLCMDDRY